MTIPHPGAPRAGALPPAALVGPAVVADFSGGGPIDAGRLESQALPAGTTRLLLRTGATGGAVTADGARWLVERGVRLVGADTLSIEAGEAPPGAPRGGRGTRPRAPPPPP